MSTHSIDEATVPAQELSTQSRGSAIRGILIGLVPLGLLAGFVALALVLTALARQLVPNTDFSVQQQAVLVTLIAGLIVAVAVFAVAIWRVLRRVAVWQQVGKRVQACATLWTLGVTALIVVMPVLLAVLLPQHPFP
jgi:cytochrome bd-type quinol oxidase subunit 2